MMAIKTVSLKNVLNLIVLGTVKANLKNVQALLFGIFHFIFFFFFFFDNIMCFPCLGQEYLNAKKILNKIQDVSLFLARMFQYLVAT